MLLFIFRIIFATSYLHFSMNKMSFLHSLKYINNKKRIVGKVYPWKMYELRLKKQIHLRCLSCNIFGSQKSVIVQSNEFTFGEGWQKRRYPMFETYFYKTYIHETFDVMHFLMFLGFRVIPDNAKNKLRYASYSTILTTSLIYYACTFSMPIMDNVQRGHNKVNFAVQVSPQ